MKYILNPVTQELDKIADIEAEIDLSQKQLEKYATQPDSTGAYAAFKKQRAKEDKIDQEIINFGKDFQPHKKKINSKYNPDEWLKHNMAMYEGDGSKEFGKDLIEDVQLQSNGEMRGMLTEKIYNAKDAITMNEKYDRNFTNPNLTGNKQTYLTANEKVLANFNPKEALEYTGGGKDKENVQYMRYVKAKAKRINDAALTPTKLADSPILKNNINSKKINNKILATKKKDPVKEIDLGSDSELLEIMEWLKSHPTKSYQDWLDNNAWLKDNFGKLNKKQGNKNQDYKIRIPRDPLELNFKSMVLLSDLEKANEKVGGLATFDPRRNFAEGSNGSTPSTPQTFQRQIEELYGVQLSGQETIAELIEMVRRLRNEKN